MKKFFKKIFKKAKKKKENPYKIENEINKLINKIIVATTNELEDNQLVKHVDGDKSINIFILFDEFGMRTPKFFTRFAYLNSLDKFPKLI